MTSFCTVLGIETSCDESALAVVSVAPDGTSKVLAEEIYSQVSLHEQYGGVVPELAAREHLIALPLLFDRLTQKIPDLLSKIDLISVTIGPGLKGCLLMGINFAKGIAVAGNIPLVGVNHIEGHIFSPLLNSKVPSEEFLALIVSGGHTELVHVQGIGCYRPIARTIDDAAGEAFDKSAHLLGFPYPGGRLLSEEADKMNKSPFQLPKVMRGIDGFSFSGLKTAVSLLVKKSNICNKLIRQQLCYSVQEAIVDALVYKTDSALKELESSKLAVVGGVSANRRLQERLSKIATVFIPSLNFCTDNASMIALVGGLRYHAKKMSSSVNLPVLPRWRVEEIDESFQDVGVTVT